MALNMSDKINPFLAAGRTLERLVTAGSIGDEVARMPCGHEFRRDALGTWLKNHSTCPVCRHQLKVGSAMAEAIAEAGGLANIEALQQHSDSDIYVKARRLIEAFFST